MGRRPCCSKEGLNRGAWSAGEDKILLEFIKKHGEGRWRDLPKRAGLRRCGKSCRLRWLNYLRPDIKRGNISPDEEDLIMRLHKLLGNRWRWSLIAGRLPGRTDNEIKNYWNTNLRRTSGHSSRESENQEQTSCGGRSNAALTSQKKPSESQQQAIRTKAVRYTKVFLPSGHQSQMDRAECENSLLKCPPFAENEHDFLMDFDADELLASDVVDSEFLQSSDYCTEATNGIAVKEDDETAVFIHPLPLDDNMVKQDWKLEGPEKLWWTSLLDDE